MKMKKTLFIASVLTLLSTSADAQRVEELSGSYVYVLTDNDNITLREAKRKCIELAKAEAIKQEFGEMVTSDVIDTNVETNGEATSSFFWENTVAMARGEWLGDTQQPKLDMRYEDGKLLITAEVKGKAREIIQSKIDLKWEILKDGADGRKPAGSFDSGERIYVSFRSPANGYVAIYLIVGDDDTSCLLPYAKDADGRFDVRAGHDYIFFDREQDPQAQHYRMKTRREQEDNQLVIIFSPNPFTKCNDVSRDRLHPNSLNTHDFQKWLLGCQRLDRDMVVSKRWIKINQKKQ